ncbi:response regulator [Bradymonadaceae bacterium TMQ3]|uniref:histidine kinase n=1 Tax=Lujinxingia sediminis TaxID=2480984 RepID=A0ABY0CQF1_9DELT|nr:ATP-binding protein [Lujinxingia sediminis]RDV37949.1 response regulator [Bradymonadaceae bacterium TMQ3]RVU42723.1 response regulator [Lujinxingia sediminis]TXC75273.1 response regulator [Bradymonadales bacterium TMQ1]
MNPNESGIAGFSQLDLRAQAEALLSKGDEKGISARDPQELIRELKLHHIELELQNKELKRCQSQLESTRERYIDLYFHAPIGYASLTAEGSIDELNFMAADHLELTRQELLHASFGELLTPSSRERFQAHLARTFSSGELQKCDVVARLPDGGQTHLRLTSVMVKGNEDTPARSRTIVMDINDEQHAERERVALQDQLRQAHKMEALGRLVSGIAHDFNNLLTLIIGYSKLAMNQLPSSNPFFAHAQQINKAGHHASELIDQLLAFSRERAPSPTRMVLNETIRDIESMLRRVTGDDIEFNLSLDEALGETCFDAAQFKQVLMNLVINACEAMPQGGRLTVRTRNIQLHERAAARLNIEPGPFVLVEVEDTGYGIPEEVVSRVFDSNFTTKSSDKTHGFGLATSQGILRQHRGVIDVVSQSDKGTSFLIYAPRIDAARAEESPAPTPTILLVEDQTDLRQLATMVLSTAGYRVLSASSPAEGVEIAELHPGALDLILTDVTMPGMNGRQLAERVLKTHPNTHVLYISGHDHESVCRERGIDLDAPFLEKPFTPERLVEIVSALIEPPLNAPTPSFDPSSDHTPPPG